MRLAYLLVADTVVIDQLTNRVSIFQIVDDVMVTGFPCVVPGWSAIAGFAVLPMPAGAQQHAILRVSGSALAEPRELPTGFASGGPHHRLVYRLEHIALQGEGEIALDLRVNGMLLGTHTIHVRQTPATDGRLTLG
jgi:hypothetical protein